MSRSVNYRGRARMIAGLLLFGMCVWVLAVAAAAYAVDKIFKF